VQLFTERATAALAKDIVSLTTSADESAHVLDDTQDADVGLAREIGGSRGDALGRDRRRRHDQLTHLGKSRARVIAMSPVPGGVSIKK